LILTKSAEIADMALFGNRSTITRN